MHFKTESKMNIKVRYIALVGGILIGYFLVLKTDFFKAYDSEKSEIEAEFAEVLLQFPAQTQTVFKAFQVNVSLSNRISLFRSIPDTRPETCLSQNQSLHDPSSVTLVIPFFNEAWSLLLRSVVSAVTRAPPGVIEEVILVDDHSDYKYLKDPLRAALEKVPVNVKIVRLPERQGLIRARMVGARAAKTEIMVFMDAHVECNEGWLEPLVGAVRRDPRQVAVPHIDAIDPETLEYQRWYPDSMGGFLWTMDYVWTPIPDKMLRNFAIRAEPVATPATIGCVFAVNRQNFFRMGGLDEDMMIWGGENLEMSFRTWMCGGSVKIHPCSRVGHVFRKYLPYGIPYKYGGGQAIFKNYQRVVDIWFDEYRPFYYASTVKVVNLTKSEMISLQKRRELKDKLGCVPFAKYLETTASSSFKPMPDASFQGLIRNEVSKGCLEFDNKANSLLIKDCNYAQSSQFFYLVTFNTKDASKGVLAHNRTFCLGSMTLTNSDNGCKGNNTVWIYNVTHTEQNWKAAATHRHIGRLMLTSRGTKVTWCLTQITDPDGEQTGALLPCMKKHPFQLWSFTYKMDFNRTDR